MGREWREGITRGRGAQPPGHNHHPKKVMGVLAGTVSAILLSGGVGGEGEAVQQFPAPGSVRIPDIHVYPWPLVS